MITAEMYSFIIQWFLILCISSNLKNLILRLKKHSIESKLFVYEEENHFSDEIFLGILCKKRKEIEKQIDLLVNKIWQIPGSDTE